MGQQWASDIVLQEFHPVWGLTAIGQGTVRKRNVELSYVSLLGVPGTASLRISDDGTTLEGHAKDTLTQASSYIKVRRGGQS